MWKIVLKDKDKNIIQTIEKEEKEAREEYKKLGEKLEEGQSISLFNGDKFITEAIELTQEQIDKIEETIKKGNEKAKEVIEENKKAQKEFEKALDKIFRLDEKGREERKRFAERMEQLKNGDIMIPYEPTTAMILSFIESKENLKNVIKEKTKDWGLYAKHCKFEDTITKESNFVVKDDIRELIFEIVMEYSKPENGRRKVEPKDIFMKLKSIFAEYWEYLKEGKNEEDWLLNKIANSFQNDFMNK